MILSCVYIVGALVDQHTLQTKSSPMEKMDSKKRKASEDEKVMEKKAKASPVK